MSNQYKEATVHQYLELTGLISLGLPAKEEPKQQGVHQRQTVQFSFSIFFHCMKDMGSTPVLSVAKLKDIHRAITNWNIALNQTALSKIKEKTNYAL